MCNYKWIRDGQHKITIRNRETGYAHQVRCWNEEIIHNVLKNQKSCEDVFITKYPKDKCVTTIVLDYDSDDNPEDAFKEAKQLRNYLTLQGHNVVLVDSTNKGTHVYCEIAPFMFKDALDDGRNIKDWNVFFKDFIYYLIHDVTKKHDCLDAINMNAGIGGNIRLIGSVHPSTGKKVEIISGEFTGNQTPTSLQEDAQIKAWHKADIIDKELTQKLKKTKVEFGDDPIKCNDLREILPQISGNPIKLYSRGYGYMCCPFHSDKKPSMLVTKEFYSCASCNARGNVFTLKKKGLVEFDDDGGVKL